MNVPDSALPPCTDDQREWFADGMLDAGSVTGAIPVKPTEWPPHRWYWYQRGINARNRRADERWEPPHA